MAMNPLDAANPKGCIDSVISRTRTKLLPQVPEMTIRFSQSVESGTSPMRLPLIHSGVSLAVVAELDGGLAILLALFTRPVAPDWRYGASPPP